MAEEKEENIVKRVCRELNFTYKQLGEKIGYSESNINKVASTGKVSEPLEKAINLYLKILEQEKEIEKIKTLRSTLKSILD